MSKRAEQVAYTRLRIVEATVELHGTIGPAGTTVMGIAEQAGVTRATVYRHFPDEDALFRACSAHWRARQDPPNPSSWARVADPFERIRVGLDDLYRFYRDGEPMLTRIYRDMASLPPEQRRDLHARDTRVRDLLLAAFPARPRRRHPLRAVLGHAVAFWTWRSLCMEHRLAEQEAVELMIELAEAASGIDRKDTKSK